MLVRRLVLGIDHADPACVHQLGGEALHLPRQHAVNEADGIGEGLPTCPAEARSASASFLLPEVLPVATKRAVLTTRFEKFTRAADFESNTWCRGLRGGEV